MSKVIEMKVPTIGESVTEVTLSQWLKADGDYVELDEPICEFESDKATLEFPAEAAGILRHVAQEDDDLEIGALVARIESTDQKPTNAPTLAPQASNQPESTPPSPAPEKSTEHPGPAAAKLMREHQITIQNGTGKDQRITKTDALQAIEAKSNSSSTTPPELTPSVPVPKVDSPKPTKNLTAYSRDESRKKMSRMRRTIADRLVSAKNEAAMLTTFNEVDMSAIFALRKKYQEKFVEKYGVKLGFMSLFAKACSKVLLEMPDVNAILNDKDLVYHDYVDISIAISTPTGLIVPPVKNVESQSFAEIELAIKALASKARSGTLTLDELSGGTFTITNGGIFGSMMSTPILNKPQSAILGMHSIVERPVAIDGKVEIRPMMYLALSYDHRVIDGSTSVTFLVKVKKLLEDPTSLLLDI